MQIGLLGGTFDPPHYGHMWLAETAKEQLNLDRVLFLPVGQPPHKQDQVVTAVQHRLAMTKLAIQSNPFFHLDTTDIDRPQPHATNSLLPIIQTKYPGARVWLLLGADSLRDFASWEAPVKIIVQCRLGVLGRPGATPDWQYLNQIVPGLPEAVDILSGPAVAISSTEIRQWAAAGNSVRYLVQTAVWQYISENKLYDRQR